MAARIFRGLESKQTRACADHDSAPLRKSSSSISDFILRPLKKRFLHRKLLEFKKCHFYLVFEEVFVSDRLPSSVNPEIFFVRPAGNPILSRSPVQLGVQTCFSCQLTPFLQLLVLAGVSVVKSLSFG